MDRLLPELAFHRLRDDVALVERRFRVVAQGQDLVAPDADTADVVVPGDELLQDHRLQAGLVVGGDQLLQGIDDVDVLPATTSVRFQHRRQACVADDRLPVKRVLQVPERAFVVDLRDVLLVGQHHGLGHGDAQLASQRALEEFFVGLPPEGVVDHDGAHQGGALQVGPVVGDLV